jgi:hypothetical protein
VLAALAGILFPVLAQARAQGRRSACLARVRQIGQAHLLYLQDWDERCSPWAFSRGPVGLPGQFPFVSWPPVEATSRWTEYLAPYLRSTAVMHDPGGWSAGLSAQSDRQADFAILTW